MMFFLQVPVGTGVPILLGVSLNSTTLRERRRSLRGAVRGAPRGRTGGAPGRFIILPGGESRCSSPARTGRRGRLRI